MTRLAEVAGLIIGSLAVLLLWLVEPFWRFRLGIIRADRIGHLAGGPEILMRKWQLYGYPRRTKHIFFAVDPCNPFLFSMLNRRLTIVENRWLNRFIHRIMPILKHTRFYEPLIDNSCHYKEMHEVSPSLYFTEDDDIRGREFLAEKGISANDWFVCIYARDPGYLKSREEAIAATFNAYRDCSIENYIKAAEWVVEKGGFVLRMGSAVEAPLPKNLHPRIIDYATKYRSDFLDVYLGAKCSFFLGCCSGLTDVSMIFGTPTAWANYVYNSVANGRKAIFAPKFLFNKVMGKFLTMPEIAALGVFPTGSDPEEKLNYVHYDVDRLVAYPEIEWVENDSEDILNMAKDMFDLIEGRKELFEETAYLHDAYLAYYGESPHNSPYTARLGPRFALRHKSLILGQD